MQSFRYELNAPVIIGERVDGEVMVMNLRDGIYYSVAGVGAAVWPALVGGCALDTIAAAVATTTGTEIATVEADIVRFAQQLVDEQILRPASAASATNLEQAVAVASYQGFAIERFDDMREMLTLDPVHEVGDFGWPQRREPAQS
ncbi:MAG: PqqD family protein [Casimicrobiaceae bacterium]